MVGNIMSPNAVIVPNINHALVDFCLRNGRLCLGHIVAIKPPSVAKMRVVCPNARAVDSGKNNGIVQGLHGKFRIAIMRLRVFCLPLRPIFGMNKRHKKIHGRLEKIFKNKNLKKIES